MRRQYIGTKPQDGIILGYRNQWRLYFYKKNGGFMHFKLIRTDEAEKGNYWISWHQDKCRITRNRDAGSLRSNYPGIYRWVQEEMKAKKVFL
jgi:hypothetical protein